MRKYWFLLPMFLPLAYPLAAAAQRTVDFEQAMTLGALAILVGGCSLLGFLISTRASRYFRRSQFWADEIGLLIAIYGFVGPMISLSNAATGLDQHLPFLVLLAMSCLTGVGAILAGGQPSGRSA